MCCIFTCCGWVIDLIQRVWVFAMSCCISSAVCCVLVTSSMSGVALGYNYSLAEYIHTKETNVSVYIKRGVFDDEVSDDSMDWRRRGHNSLKGFVRDEGNLKTAPPDEPEQMPAERSGRRLDDTILESDSNHRFEGHLMKLTMSPPHPSTTTKGVTSDLEMVKAMSPFTSGSLDQLKALQGIINKRKMTAYRDGMSTYAFDESKLVYGTASPGQFEEELNARRMMHILGRNPDIRREGSEFGTSGKTINPARYAVPDPSIGGDLNWMGPKLPPELYKKIVDPENIFPALRATYPSPPTFRTGPIRPEPTTSFYSIIPHLTSTVRTIKLDQAADIERLKERISDNEMDKEPFMKPMGSMVAKTDASDYYEEENVRGLPVRKKRSIMPIREKQKTRAKFEQNIKNKINLVHLTKSSDGGGLTNEVVRYPSVLVSKLHFSNNADSKETSTNEPVEVENEPTMGMDLSKDETFKIKLSLFS